MLALAFCFSDIPLHWQLERVVIIPRKEHQQSVFHTTMWKMQVSLILRSAFHLKMLNSYVLLISAVHRQKALFLNFWEIKRKALTLLFFKTMTLFEGQNKSLNSSLIVSSMTCNQALWEVRWMGWRIYFFFLPEWIFHCNFCFFVFWLEVEMMERVCNFLTENQPTKTKPFILVNITFVADL